MRMTDGTPQCPLVTAIAYATPSPNPSPSVTEAHNVTFEYDPAGNRKSMSDGSGTMDYKYDELSRLISETKKFDPAPTSQPTPGYALTYTYHLNGSVKSMTDQYGYQAYYSVDKTGRTTSIGSSSTLTATFASGISYRAFGGAKTMSLSADQQIDINFTYDSAQRIASYTAHSDANKSGDIHNAQYAYNKDGTVSGVTNNADPNFSQTNKFDFVGRLKYNNVAHVGYTNPYSQTLDYDGYGNLTGRTNTLYSFDPVLFTATYTNNRKSAGTGSADSFDNAGNITWSDAASDDKYWYFDAAGHSWKWTETGPWGTTQQKGEEIVFDGDGRAAKQSELNYTLGTGWTGRHRRTTFIRRLPVRRSPSLTTLELSTEITCTWATQRSPGRMPRT